LRVAAVPDHFAVNTDVGLHRQGNITARSSYSAEPSTFVNVLELSQAVAL